MELNLKKELLLSFLNNDEFESIRGLPFVEQSPVIARNLLRLLMMGWSPLWIKLITPPVLRAIFFKQNETLLKHLRKAYQQGFIHIFEQIKAYSYASNEFEQIQLYLSNCLAFLPYMGFKTEDVVSIPQYIDNQWLMIEYQINCILMNKPKDCPAIFRRNRDNVFAYGLKAIVDTKAHSHLIFTGTTYPAAPGFWYQMYSNLKAFETVGESLYLMGRNSLHAWLAQQKMTHVCGISLGGSLSLLLALDSGPYSLSRVDALNPAGLYKIGLKNTSNFGPECRSNRDFNTKVVIQKQGSDPVSELGFWKEDWQIIQVIGPSDKKGPSRIWDHFLNYAGFAEKLIYLDPKKDNVIRSKSNFWLYTVARSLIFYFALLPYLYIVRPVTFFISENPLLVFLCFMMLLVFFIV